MIINVPQLRAARALLGWSQDQLAEKSGVSKPTIARLELGSSGEIGGYASTQAKLKGALEAAGVIFVQENGDGPGVRLRKQPGAESATESRHDEAVRREEANMAGVDAAALKQNRK